MKDLAVLNHLIIGRVDPHIYAFTTNTIPNYLKVGDTYRPVAIRLQEWRSFFPDLQKEYDHIAKVSDDTYFRDFAVHQYLEQEKGLVRLSPADLSTGIYYSKEFFRDATVQDVADAVSDIQQGFDDHNGKYQFYNAETTLPETYTYNRTETYAPRPNQQETINRFKAAVESGRTNLLMYAVMRFGKSFTSMCCATEIEAKIVTVVSAKADVKEEWKKTVESHTRFAEYIFLTGNDLLSNQTAIRETLAQGKRAVVFLTLQDLQGEVIKEKHREIFGTTIDLLIVDETHFGARAEKYGQVLRSAGYVKDDKDKHGNEDFIEVAEADEQIKILNARIKLHLSGTPYRILMGSEFDKEDIIAFYQFTDIVKDQEEWTTKNNAEDEPKEEWENPYYGFPQMIRFAFHPNRSSLQRLKELRANGVLYAFSALLKPRSIKKADDGSHKKFVYEQEILDLLSVIDGSKEDDELLGFLDYEKIKSGSMCRHIVCVLPYCASCDAMEALIRNNTDQFKNLGSYEIINISGVDKPNDYKTAEDIKRKIRQCEEAGQKTLTLTVNRMLTGSTVEQWDTMLFLKDTASPQEYDQAIFRLQNQYVKKYVSGDHIIKYNMKPQTLLVDFDPARMFAMQEQKSQIYNVNTDEAGNSKLEERIREELRISPIIVLNSDKMEQVQAVDILRAVSEYSKTRGVAEETAEIPVDLSLMDIDAVRQAIENENELGSKAGFTTKAHEGEGDGTDLDIPDDTEAGDQDTTDEDEQETGPTVHPQAQSEDEKNTKDPVKQFRSYYARILFFAFLTRDAVISLDDIITKMETQDNARIARNIGISKAVLAAMQENINKFILRDLDYKIQNLNRLSHDESVNPIDRASVAVKKFGKLGESEVITPRKICNDMVALIPDDAFINAVRDGHKILDIAGKAGEFALAVYERMKSIGCDETAIRRLICTIPTSGITYEFTRMVYDILGLDVNNLAERFTAYDLLEVRDEKQKVDYNKIAAFLMQAKPFNTITLQDDIAERDENVKFDIVLGNPPYQENIGTEGVNDSLGKQLFPSFMRLTMNLSQIYSSMIVPSKWFTGKAQDGSFLSLREYIKTNNHFQKITNCLNGREVFPDVSTGSVMYYLFNKDYNGDVEFSDKQNSTITVLNRPLFENGLDVVIPMNSTISILQKVREKEFVSMENLVTGRNPFGVPATDNSLLKKTVPSSDANHTITILCAYEEIRYIAQNEITRNVELLKKWKVFTSKINGAAGTILDGKPVSILGKTFVMGPNCACSNTLLAIGAFDTASEATNLDSYMKTKFFRFMLGIKKNANVLTSNIYSFVPVQDFSKPWTDAELYAKYNLTDDEIAFIESTIKPME